MIESDVNVFSPPYDRTVHAPPLDLSCRCGAVRAWVKPTRFSNNCDHWFYSRDARAIRNLVDSDDQHCTAGASIPSPTLKKTFVRSTVENSVFSGIGQ
jgi:hypothetical protein